MSSFLNTLWYEKNVHLIHIILLPLALIYYLIVQIRRQILERFYQKKYSVPIVIVGNITTGGVGKTPLVIAIVKKLTQKGYCVGIVSRGYRAQVQQFPYEVNRHDSASTVGDEPLLIAQKTGCPVVISPKRNQAVSYLVHKYPCDIIISDDGLQHYSMGRALEIAVVDGTRGIGNGWCLPAGPLREPKTRLQEADFIVVNEGYWHKAYPMSLKPSKIIHLISGKEYDAHFFLNRTIAAVAAIGNPQRFYAALSQLGISFIPYSYPDHYFFKKKDLSSLDIPIIMTEKDAIKCHSFQLDTIYYLPVEAVLDSTFWHALWSHQQLKDLH